MIHKNEVYMFFKKVFFWVIPFITIILAAGCSEEETVTGGNGGGQTQNEVIMSGSAFSPANITVSVGTTVTWTNNDNLTHNVISGTPGSPTGVFSSGDLGANQTFSYTFNQEGTFNYFCSYHPGMAGTVTVEAEGPPEY